jgi:hypothetical protein
MSPRRLPVVTLDGEAYFFDLRLSQLRKVSEPYDFIDLLHGERRDLLGALLLREVAATRHRIDPPTGAEEDETSA